MVHHKTGRDRENWILNRSKPELIIILGRAVCELLLEH